MWRISGSYAYDSADRLLTVTNPDGEVVTQDYNGRGLPSGLTIATPDPDVPLLTGLSYNALGLPTDITFDNSLKTSYGYWNVGGTGDNNTDCQPSLPTDCYGRLWEIKTAQTSGSPILQQLQHTWDATGNMAQRKDLVVAETETYACDFLDRLTSASAAADVTSGLVGWWKLDEGTLRRLSGDRAYKRRKGRFPKLAQLPPLRTLQAGPRVASSPAPGGPPSGRLRTCPGRGSPGPQRRRRQPAAR